MTENIFQMVGRNISLLVILFTFFSCKKGDKILFKITREDNDIKKVQYVCAERKTGLKYILEYIGDTTLDRKYYLNSKFRPEGQLLYYDKQGNIIETSYLNEHGNADGLSTNYYASGKVKEIHYYNNGVEGLVEYYLENGFLKCVYFFDGEEKMVHKKNIILENGIVRDTMEELYAMIRVGKDGEHLRPLGKFVKDTVSAGEEFSIWFKRPKSKYVSDTSQWLLVYDIQKIRKNTAFRDPTNELVLDTLYAEQKIRLYEKGQNLLYYDMYKDSNYLCSSEPLLVFVK